MPDIFATRREKLRKLLKKQNVDAILVTNFTNVAWLTGFTGGDSYLLLDLKGECLLSDFRYKIQIQNECPRLDFVIRTGNVCLSELVGIALRRISDSPRLGVESNSITVKQVEALREKATEDIVPLDSMVETLRQVKDKQEIQLIREAGRIASKAFYAVRAMLTPDWTEKQVADELEFNMRRLGAKEASFPTIVAVGSNAALCHCVPGNRKIGEAGFVLVDWGARYKGYVSDLTRVIVTGRVSSEFHKIYSIVRDAQLKAIEAVKPGVLCCEVDAIARNYIADAGYGEYFDHGLGHGIGLDIHEMPSFSPRCETILKPGMVITVEPGIYIKGWGGIRIEDDILVTRDGCEVLTDVEK